MACCHNVLTFETGTVMRYSRLPSVKLEERVSRLRLTARLKAGQFSTEDPPRPRCLHLDQLQMDHIQLLTFLLPSLHARTLTHQPSSITMIQLDQDPLSHLVVRPRNSPPITIPDMVSLGLQLP